MKEDEKSLVDILANAIEHALLFPNNPATPLLQEALELYYKHRNKKS
jgi:hypothetical protein